MNETAGRGAGDVATSSGDSGAASGAAGDEAAPARGVFCNRTLNMRSMRAIGYDMDYTLVHYHVQEWERRAYEQVRTKLLDRGWPVGDLVFNAELVTRGLIIDRDLGNVVKANRFGYIKLGYHGTRRLDFEAQRSAYARTEVDLAEARWVFLNTLFSVSEALMYTQAVDLLDAGGLGEVLGYADLHDRIRACVDEAHMEGVLKAEIVADPERFVVLDPGAATTLLDQHRAGKRLLLITNSDWDYTRFMMSYTYDRFLPGSMTWRDLFELVVVSARKPSFFHDRTPAFQLVEDSGLLKPCPAGIVEPGVYVAGNAALVEEFLGLDGSEILFVGDHIYGDVHVSKSVRRWRAALVVRELEGEMESMEAFRPQQEAIEALMTRKTLLERELAHLRMDAERPPAARVGDAAALAAGMARLRSEIGALDSEIGPLARAAGRLLNRRWGLLMRTGNDKSHLARQVERHADVYTSRVSNLGFETPFAYFRSPRGSLPHDPGATPDPWDPYSGDGPEPTL